MGKSVFVGLAGWIIFGMACGGAAAESPLAAPKDPDFSVAAVVAHVEGEMPARDSVALAERFWSEGKPIPRAYKPDGDCCDVGLRRDFNAPRQGGATAQGELAVVTNDALWYVESNATVSRRDLRAAAAAFETDTAPAMRAILGDAWSGGIDGDRRLVVMHLALGLDSTGYFGYDDLYPRAVYSRSNEAEMFHVGMRPGSRGYQPLLARLWARGALWMADRGEEAWVVDGLIDAAIAKAGYGEIDYDWGFDAPVSYWGTGSDVDSARAAAFIAFAAERAGGLGAIANEPADGLRGLERALAREGHSLDDAFFDFASERIARGGDDSAEIIDGDYAEYYELPRGGVRIYDVGGGGWLEIEMSYGTETSAAPELCDEGCWWSGSSDWAHSYLERQLDLSGPPPYELRFAAWWELERFYDYFYVTVSRDGKAWRAVGGERVDDRNPAGAALGVGYTGSSDGWVDETVDLSDYAGERVMLRFETVTDRRISLDGMMIKDVRIGGDVLEQAFEPVGFLPGDYDEPAIAARLAIWDETGELRWADADVAIRDDKTIVSFSERILGKAALIVAHLGFDGVRPAEYAVAFEMDQGGM